MEDNCFASFLNNTHESDSDKIGKFGENVTTFLTGMTMQINSSLKVEAMCIVNCNCIVTSISHQ